MSGKHINNNTEDAIDIVKIPVSAGTAYMVDKTIYLYTNHLILRPAEMVKNSWIGDDVPKPLHDQTASMRQWADSNSLPYPRDTDDLYNYVMTIGDEPLPVVWPTKKYFEKHNKFSVSKIELYTPTVVYPIGTHEMCRFGHMKRPIRKGNGVTTMHCYRCAWWRQQGIDLSKIKPTHCLKGHVLKDNVWLSARKGIVKEHCVQCNNEEVIARTGYVSNNFNNLRTIQ